MNEWSIKNLTFILLPILSKIIIFLLIIVNSGIQSLFLFFGQVIFIGLALLQLIHLLFGQSLTLLFEFVDRNLLVADDWCFAFGFGQFIVANHKDKRQDQPVDFVMEEV